MSMTLADHFENQQQILIPLHARPKLADLLALAALCDENINATELRIYNQEISKLRLSFCSTPGLYEEDMDTLLRRQEVLKMYLSRAALFVFARILANELETVAAKEEAIAMMCRILWIDGISRSKSDLLETVSRAFGLVIRARQTILPVTIPHHYAMAA